MPTATPLDRAEHPSRPGTAGAATASMERTRARIDALVKEIAELSRGEQTPGEFYHEVLIRVVSAIGALGGVAWAPPATGGAWGSLAALNADHVGELSSPVHSQLLAHIAAECRPASVSAEQFQAGGGAALPWLLLLVPVVLADQTVIVLELLQRPDVTAGTVGGNLRFAVRMAGLAVDYETRQRYGRLQQAERTQKSFAELGLALHAGLDPQTVAGVVVHDGRTWTGCDRLAICEPSGRRTTLCAISGQDGFDRRATVVRLLERLASQSLLLGEPVWYEGEAGSCAPQWAQAADAVLGETRARGIATLPLRRPTGDLVGVLVAEQFEPGPWRPEVRERLTLLAQHAGVALGNAQEHRSIPLLPLWRMLGTRGLPFRSWPRWILAAVCLAGLVWVAATTPASLEMRGQGTLEPVQRREIFARLDGVVGEVCVEHGQRVAAGQTLAMLRNDELEQRRAALRGEARHTQTNIDALRATRTTQWSAEERSRHASRLRSLEETLTGLNQQADLLDQQAAQLEVTSPMAGEVVTWDVGRLLKARPVSRGQILMTVADASGPWLVEAPLPEDRAGPVAAAWQAASARGEKLKASFVLATEPSHVYEGAVEAIAGRADLDPQHGNTVLVTVAFDRGQMPAELLRPGAAATVKIDCGKQPVGLVWLHDVCNWFHREVAFRFW